MKTIEVKPFRILAAIFLVMCVSLLCIPAQAEDTGLAVQAAPVTPDNTMAGADEQKAVTTEIQPEGNYGIIQGSEQPAVEGAVPEAAVSENADPEDVMDADIQQVLVNQGIIAAPAAPVEVPDEASRYTLGTDDVIKVTVERHPEVSGEFIINNEGKMQYEFVGDIELIGLNKAQAEALIKERLSKFIIAPQVTVTILQYNSKIVYVIGEVGSPGKIFMRGDTITVREALIQANLPLLSAKTAKSRLITPSANGKPKMVRVDVHRLLYEGDLRENLVMKPGDVLYIPPTIMAKALRVIQPVAAPISSAGGVARQTTTGF